MMQQQQQLLVVIFLILLGYILYNPNNILNSILGRTILVISIILSTKYNVMLGLGLMVVVIFLYANSSANGTDYTYLEGLENASNDTATAKKQVPTIVSTANLSTGTVPTGTPGTTGTTAPQIDATELSSQLNKLLVGMQSANAGGIPSKELAPVPKEGFKGDRISVEHKLRAKPANKNIYQGKGLEDNLNGPSGNIGSIYFSNAGLLE
jgi:hypothetical protein